MTDDRRCLIYSAALDASVEGIGTECDVPGAQPLPADDAQADAAGVPNQANAPEQSPQTLAAPAPPPQQAPPPAQPPTATSNGTSARLPGGGPTVANGDPPPEPVADPSNSWLSALYLRPLAPVPDYAIADALSAQGLGGLDLAQAMAQIVHNDAPAGQPHPQLGTNDRPTPVLALDPIDLFSGAYQLTVTDVHLPSRGFDIEFTRTYRSGAIAWGPWGFGWDHRYNVYARELEAGAVAIWTGFLHEDVYRPGADDRLEPPLGRFHALERGPDAAIDYVLMDAADMRWEFGRPPAWPLADRIPLLRIVDRHGNTHRLGYDNEGRLASVTDDDGRGLTLDYGSCGLLEALTDHTGRTWRYSHDDAAEHLVAVTAPAPRPSAASPTTGYEYSSDHPHPALRHNMTRLVDADGQTVCENRYGDDPAGMDFGRVVAQLFGGVEVSLCATELQIVPRDPEYVNAPTLRVEVAANRDYSVHTFNFRGDVLDERRRLVRDGTRRLVARSFRYDQRGSLAERWEPDGSGLVFVRDVDHDEPRARANILQVVAHGSALAAVPERTVATYRYDESGLRLVSARDAAGATTRFGYAAGPARPAAWNLVEIDHPTATLPDGIEQPRVERFVYDDHGALTAHETATGTRDEFEYGPAGADAGRLVRVLRDTGRSNEEERIEYDAWGHPSAVVDGLGHRWEQDMDALGRVVARRGPPVGGVVDEVTFEHDGNGRVVREHWPRGTYDDGVLADPYIAHEYSHDELGRLVEARFGANCGRPVSYRFSYEHEGDVASVTDPLGRTSRYIRDERGLLLGIVEAAGQPEEARWQASFDAAGRRRSVTDPTGRRIDFERDPWGGLSRIVLAGAPDESRTAITLNRDVRGDLVSMDIRGRQADGANGRLTWLELERDERQRVLRTRSPLGSSEVWHDADERRVRLIDSAGRTSSWSYDGRGRLARAEDAAGNAATNEFDAAGRLRSVRFADVLADGSVREYTYAYEHDALGRPTAHVDPLGARISADYDSRGLVVAQHEPGGSATQFFYDLQHQPTSARTLNAAGAVVAEHTFTRDLAGRLRAYADPLGHTTEWSYDARDRCVAITGPDGAIRRFHYGAGVQIAEEETPSGTRIRYTYGPDAALAQMDVLAADGTPAMPELRLDHDGLRRLVRASQGPHVAEREFDFLSRLVIDRLDGQESRMLHEPDGTAASFTFPDGRVDALRFDALGRLATRTLERPGASGAVASLAAGATLVDYAFDGPDRPARRQALAAVETTHAYDAAPRLVGIEHLDGSGQRLSAESYARDRAGRARATWSGPAPQSPLRHRYDDLGHLAESAGVDVAAPGPLESQADADAYADLAEAGPERASWRYDVDAADGRTRAEHTGDGAVDERLRLDGAGRIAELTRFGPDGGDWPFTHDPDGAVTLDDQRRHRYDALGRLVEVQSLDGAETLRLEYDPLGRLAAIEGDAGRTTLHHHGPLRVQAEGAGGTAQYTHGAGPNELALVSQGRTHVLLTDGRESVLAAADEAGTVTDRFSYDPFGIAAAWDSAGAARRPVPSFPLEPQFATYPALGLGLYYARARVYDPGTGRFLQPDARGLDDGPSLYAFVGGDPVNVVDPTGEAGILAGLIVAAVIGAVASAGINALHQEIAIYEGAQQGFKWGELLGSAVTGAGTGILLGFAPELAVPLALMGVANGVGEIAEGHTLTAAFDIGVSVLPFAFSGVRSSVFAEGTWGRGLGAGARLANFRTVGSGGRVAMPGVRTQQTQVPRGGTTVPAWAKSVATRLPVLAQWAARTLEAQQAVLAQLRGAGVRAAEVYRAYEPNGALVLEDAGETATAALQRDPSLLGQYRQYMSEAGPPAAGRAGRVPILGRVLGRFGRALTLHDLRPENIGYRPGQGFMAFDPTMSGNWSGFGGAASFYGLGAVMPEGVSVLDDLLHPRHAAK